MSLPRHTPVILDSAEAAADALIEKLGKDIRIGLPLGLGKPIQLINALYARAKSDPSLQLTILTALSLEKPVASSALEARFLQPFIDRVFGDCPDLDYMLALRANQLPANVQIKEFFFKPGSNLDCANVQRNYISSNYTFAARDVFNQGCNVSAQLICKRDTPEGLRYSLACNPDTSPELIELLRASGRPHAVVGLVNQHLPYMARDAEVAPALFDFVIDHPRYHTTLFSTPKLAVATPDYAIGLYASALIKDGGTLQVGIGGMGDAIIHAALIRHRQPEVYRAALTTLGALDHYGPLIEDQGGITAFEQGLYGASEMFVDGFMQLYHSGILKRAVYDFWALQQLVNDGRCKPEALTASLLTDLEELGLRVIRTQDFEVLQHHGFFNAGTRYDRGYLIAPDGARVVANVADPEARSVMARCLGTQLKNGIVLHAGFFLGPRAFYDALRALPEDQRLRFCMTGVNKVNQLDHNPRLYKAQRQHARFMNIGIMVTLSGAVISDGLADGRVVSGVGGQYNFVAMAQQLPKGRSILMLRAVRDKEGKTSRPTSNVVFNYGHITIPRHLRDIVITEYGIADLRSKTDNEVAKALLNIADSRFQAALLTEAKASGKVEAEYRIPAAFCNNTPQALAAKLSGYKDQLPAFPFGTDLTIDEIKLGKALKTVKAVAAKSNKLKLAFNAWRYKTIPDSAQPYLARMGLSQPQTLQDKVVRMLLVQALSA